MPQFYVKQDNVKDDSILITEKSDRKHIVNVLRSRVGDEVILVDDNEFTYRVCICEIASDAIATKVVEKYKSFRKLKTNLVLAQSILKSSAQDFVVQKATELGVKKIIPMQTQYTVVKFKNDKDKAQKVNRWQKIAFESCKQCERSDIPEISDIYDFNSVLESASDYDVVLACVERNAQDTIKNYLREVMPNELVDKNILVIVGPEGGWHDSELNVFKEKDIRLLTLGNLILRAETAVVNALSGVIYEYEL